MSINYVRQTAIKPFDLQGLNKAPSDVSPVLTLNSFYLSDDTGICECVSLLNPSVMAVSSL